MTERERLIELLRDATFGVNVYTLADHLKKETIEAVADYLLTNGVIVPPVKVGDGVYYIDGGYYKEPKFYKVSRPCRVVEVSLKLQRNSDHVMRGFITDNGTRYNFDSIGKSVFLTKEDCEKAIERRKK